MDFSLLNRFYRLGPKLETPIFCRATLLTRYPIFILLAFILSIIPILWYSYLPLADYPNHLARIQIHKDLSSNPYLSTFFEFHWALSPYLGFDLLTLPFMYYLPIQLVGKIVIVISFLIIYVGTVLLDRQLNHDAWRLSLFSGIFFYNGSFMYGFITYLIGVGFAICAFWVWVRYREKADGLGILVFILSAGLVYLIHIYAFGIYAICVAGYECSLLWDRLRVERHLRASLLRIPLSAAVSLIIPVLVLWFSAISSSSGPLPWGHPGPTSWAHPWAAYDSVFWSAVAGKGEALASPIFYCDPVFEIPLLLIIFALFVWALATQTIVANSRMVIPLGALVITFIAMPYSLFGSAYADYRLPTAIAFIALTSFGWGKTSQTRVNTMCLFLGACLIVRVGSVFSDWQPAQAIIAQYDRALQLVPPGSRLLVIVGHTFWGDRKPPLRHVPVLAAAMRGVFVPSTFTDANATANGLKLKRKYRDYQEDVSTGGSPRGGNLKNFDYLIAIRHPPLKIPAGITLKDIERGQTFVLYRIERQRLPTKG